MFNRYAKVCVIAVSAMAISSCTTLTRGTTQSLLVTSNKPNTSIKLSTGETGHTPVSFNVKRKQTIALTAQRGSKVQSKTSVPEVKAGAVVEALLGSVILWGPFNIMDYFNGSTKEHEAVHFDM